MTNKELLLSINSYEEFDKNRNKFISEDFVDEEVRRHLSQIFPRAYAPKDVHHDIPQNKENAWLFEIQE